MSLPQQTLALAGLFQACGLARDLAQTGAAPTGAFETAVASVLALEADSTEAVYGGVEQLAPGLDRMQACLHGEEPDVLRLVFALLALERKLMRRDDLLETLRLGILEARRQAEHLGLTHGTVLDRLADTYRITISTLRPRILVHGSPQYLKQASLVARIRSALLAGMRSAVLWRQRGGSRLGLMFRRARVVEEARRQQARIAGPTDTPNA